MVQPIYLCPSTENCQWEGFQEDILNHFNKNHPNFSLNTNNFNLDLNQDFSANYLMHLNDETFLIQFKYYGDIAEIRLRFLGTVKRAKSLSYHVEIDSGNFAFNSKHHSEGNYSLITRKDGAVLVDVSGIRTICGKKLLNNVVCFINIEGMKDEGFAMNKSISRRSYHEKKVLDSKVREIFQRNSSFRSSIRKKTMDNIEFESNQKKSVHFDDKENEDFVEDILDDIIDDVVENDTENKSNINIKSDIKITSELKIEDGVVVKNEVKIDEIEDDENVMDDFKMKINDELRFGLRNNDFFPNFYKPFDDSFFDEDDVFFQESFLRGSHSSFFSETTKFSETSRFSESSEISVRIGLGSITEHEHEYKSEHKHEDKEDDVYICEEEEKRGTKENEKEIFKETILEEDEEIKENQEVVNKSESNSDDNVEEENNEEDKVIEKNETPQTSQEYQQNFETEETSSIHPLILRPKSSKLTPNRLSKAEMEYYEKINLMRCESCSMIMIPPIFVCLNGHSVCITCKPLNCSCKSGVTDMRNIDLEEISRSLTHPCRFLEKGCTELYSCYEIRFHEIKCDYFLYKCPMCEFTGKYMDVFRHVRLFHPSLKIVDAMEYAFPKNSEFLIVSKYGIFYCTSQIYIDTIEWSVVFTGREKISFSCQVVIKTKKNSKVYHLKRNGNTCKIIIHLNDLKNNRVKDKNAVLYIKTNS
nr:uncharacterized protein LOC111423976 [Onthophagus taurus]